MLQKILLLKCFVQFLDKNYHGLSRPVQPLLCMLEVFWKTLQHFEKFRV